MNCKCGAPMLEIGNDVSIFDGARPFPNALPSLRFRSSGSAMRAGATARSVLGTTWTRDRFRARSGVSRGEKNNARFRHTRNDPSNRR